MEKSPYISFDKYALRTPLLPLSWLKELTGDKEISEEKLKTIFSENTLVQEALFLASPSLYEHLQKWIKNEISQPKEVEKLCYSFLKYLSRMCSRCTPFGLFAGTAIGQISDSTKIELTQASEFNRHTRLDMNYLIALSQNLAKDPSIKQQLKYYPNNSLYLVGNQWRYIEYYYGQNNRRIHQMVSVEDSDYLRIILEKAQSGSSLSELAQLLASESIPIEEVSEFIQELVDGQFLVSELEPAVSGPEFSGQILSSLERLSQVSDILSTFQQAHEMIGRLDEKMGNDSARYIRITKDLKALGTDFKLKHMFQTDMGLRCKKNNISQSISAKVQDAMELMVKVSLPPETTLLQQFGKAFYERYEGKMVPLAQALDVEIGIGYKQEQVNTDVNPLIDDIVVPSRNPALSTRISLTPAQQILHQKLIECLQSGEKLISLSKNDFQAFKANWSDLPDTVSTMIELVSENGQEKISVGGFGGSSAANLLGRFCHGDKNIYDFTKNIVEKETEMNRGKIIAEIVHLPEARTGNILMRPSLREYEIPFLAKSCLADEKQISLDDLLIGASATGHIILISKSRNKEVVPRLSNAHNYSNRSLPIYHFLADLQLQNKRMIGFNWGNLTQIHKYLPRVEYEDIILSKAQWTFTKDNIDSLSNEIKHDGLESALRKWKHIHKIPKYVVLAESDNELLINTENLTSFKMLLKAVNKKTGFQLKEFLYTEDTIVKQGGNEYTNQVIMSFYNSNQTPSA